MDKLISGFLIAFVLLLEDGITEFFRVKLAKFSIPNFWLLILVFVFLFIVYVLLNFTIPRAIRGIPFVRKFLFRRARFEGVWLQTIRDGKNLSRARPYSISKIRYNYRNNDWEYYGNAYSAKFKRRASWNSQSIDMDRNKLFWNFRGESIRYSSGQRSGDGNVTTILYLDPTTSYQNRPDEFEGRIFDIDQNDAPKGLSITLVRILQSDLKDVELDGTGLPKSETDCLAIKEAVFKRGKN